MKRTVQTMMMALALGVSGLAAVAQPADAPPPGDAPPQDGPPGGPGRGGFKPPLITALDANGDGIISADEIANASAALKKLDKNGDGQLTPDEYMGGRPGPRGKRPGGPNGPSAGSDNSGPGVRQQGDRPPHDGPPGAQGQGARGDARGGMRPPPPPLVAALDADGDGIISAEEIANAPAALKKLDKNGDGQLTMDEIRPRGRGPHGPGGPDGQRPPPGEGGQPNTPPGNQ